MASLALLLLPGCRSPQRDPRTVVFLIDSSPANLDPRVGTDGQSEHIDELIFDGLVAQGRELPLHPRPRRELGSARRQNAHLPSA